MVVAPPSASRLACAAAAAASARRWSATALVCAERAGVASLPGSRSFSEPFIMRDGRLVAIDVASSSSFADIG